MSITFQPMMDLQDWWLLVVMIEKLSTFTHQAEADKVRANNNSCWDIANTLTLSLRINFNRAQKNLCADRNLWFHSSHCERLLEVPICLLQRWSSTASTSPFLTCSPYGPPLLCREPTSPSCPPLNWHWSVIPRLTSPFCHYCSFESCCSPP